MLRRVVALTALFAVMGAPLAARVCEATCAHHSAHSGAARHLWHSGADTSASDHHHAAAASTGNVPTIEGSRPECDHPQLIPAASRDTTRGWSPTIVIVPAVATLVDAPAGRAPTDVESRHGPPGHSRPITQLRI